MDESTLIGRLWRHAMEGLARLRSGRPTATKLELAVSSLILKLRISITE